MGFFVVILRKNDGFTLLEILIAQFVPLYTPPIRQHTIRQDDQIVPVNLTVDNDLSKAEGLDPWLSQTLSP